MDRNREDMRETPMEYSLRILDDIAAELKDKERIEPADIERCLASRNIGRVHVRTSKLDDLQHFKLSRDERLRFLKNNYPQGFPILGTGKYLKWGAVAGYELFALQYNRQALPTLMRRGGLSPDEAWALRNGTPERKSKISDQEIMREFEEREWLVKPRAEIKK